MKIQSSSAALFFAVVLIPFAGIIFGRINGFSVDLPLSEIRRAEIKILDTKVIQGDSTDEGSKYNCKGQIAGDDTLRGFTAVAKVYQNGCYTDGRFNAREFEFSVFEFRWNGSEQSYPGVQVAPPVKKPEKFLGSVHHLAYKFPEKKDYTIYRVSGNSLNVVSLLPASRIRPGEYTIIPEAKLSVLQDKTRYVVLPADAKITPYGNLNGQTEGAWTRETQLGRAGKIRIQVGGTPFDTRMDYTAGPSSHSNIYGMGREFFFLDFENRTSAILWQDKKSGAVVATYLDEKLLRKEERILDQVKSKRYKLIAATSDHRGRIYLVYAKTKSASSQQDRMVTVHRFTPGGKKEKSVSLNTSKKELNVFSIATDIQSSSNIADLKFSRASSPDEKGLLSLILSRTMHKSSDGLNHQGAIALLLDPETLQVIRNTGQTSGHSFGNYMIPLENRSFAAIDLGDNYPRGVHLHVFDEKRRESRVVFSFKTNHGKTPASPAGKRYPLYREISKGGRNYYQWSNDNRTYTEIGGIAKTENGFLVSFASETPMLANERTDQVHNDPRNMFVVHVKHPFGERGKSWHEIHPDLILTDGHSAHSRFYDFGGRVNRQTNIGAKLLTEYNSIEENASRPKMLKLDRDRFLVLWEKWTSGSYQETFGVVIDSNGDFLAGPDSLGRDFRLGRQDDVFLYGNHLISISGMSKEQMLEINLVQLKD